MNGRVEDRFAHSSAGQAEQTLRLIASLPAPEGLEERVHSALKDSRPSAGVLAWPSQGTVRRRWAQSGVVRGAAAAAIIFVVAGGGWGVYSRVQPARSPKVIAMPRIAGPGGFSTGSAIRTPQTLIGPVLGHPNAARPKKTDAEAGVQKQRGKKRRPQQQKSTPTP